MVIIINRNSAEIVQSVKNSYEVGHYKKSRITEIE